MIATGMLRRALGKALSRACAAAAGLLVLAATQAMAEDLTVEVDHALLLRLDRDADLVHIANPGIADISVETPRMMFVIGLAPGETGLYILDRDGNELIVGDVLVTPNTSHEVTLNRNTQEFTYSCSPRCVEVAVTGQANPGVSAAGGSGAGTSDLSGLGLEE